MMTLGQKYLITTDQWFTAPDGQQYAAVFGTVHELRSDAETLGIKTNARSTNWYILIGKMIVAGCQVQYAIRTDEVSDEPPTRENAHEGRLIGSRAPVSQIYRADEVTK